MDLPLFEQLHNDGHLSTSSLSNIKKSKQKPLFSLHWELKTLLYLGVLLLSGGLGILVYKNLDTIGHQAILAGLAAICMGSYFYCFKNAKPYTNQQVETINSFYDYILLLGCLSLLTFIGYLQFQYQVFGTRYGLATFIPMLCLFFCAYYFDNPAILSMAVVNLAAWAGIAVTPRRILLDNDFSNERLIFTGIALAVLLMVLAYFSKKKNIKAHFEFTYTNFGTNLLFISCLAAMFHFEGIYLLWFAVLIGLAVFYYVKAKKEKSFYYILLLTLYGFIGLTYVVIDFIFSKSNLDIGGAYLVCFYFIGAAVCIIFFLIRTNRKFKTNDRLQP